MTIVAAFKGAIEVGKEVGLGVDLTVDLHKSKRILDRFLNARPGMAHVNRPCVAAKRVNEDQTAKFCGESEQRRLGLLA